MQSTRRLARGRHWISRWALPVSLGAAIAAAGCSEDADDGGGGAGTGAGKGGTSTGGGGNSAGSAGSSSGGKAGAGAGTGGKAGAGSAGTNATGGTGEAGSAGDAGSGETGGAGDAGGAGGSGGSGGGAGAGGAAGAGGNLFDVCPGAVWRPISFEAPETLPSPDDLTLPDVPSFAEVVAAGDGYDNSVRLDVCEAENGTLSLGSVLHVEHSFGMPTLYRVDPEVAVAEQNYIEIDGGMIEELRLPPSDVVITGLAAALEGDYAGFSVEFQHEWGAVIGGADDFVAFARGNVSDTRVEYNSIYFVAGTLVPGDVFAGRSCAFGEAPLETSFSLDTATFDVEACTFLGGGETTAYRITSLAVTDTNSALGEEERERHEFSGETAVAEVLDYRWNHHNACDSFHLALPHANYAASSSPSAGCGETVPEAPPRTIDDYGLVKFRIRYHGGAWTEGEHPECAHYLFFCTPMQE